MSFSDTVFFVDLTLFRRSLKNKLYNDEYTCGDMDVLVYNIFKLVNCHFLPDKSAAKYFLVPKGAVNQKKKVEKHCPDIYLT